MKTQAETVKQWKTNMDALRKRGVSGDLLKDLESAGVSSAGDVSTLAAMSDAQLSQYKNTTASVMRLLSRRLSRKCRTAKEHTGTTCFAYKSEQSNRYKQTTTAVRLKFNKKTKFTYDTIKKRGQNVNAFALFSKRREGQDQDISDGYSRYL